MMFLKPNLVAAAAQLLFWLSDTSRIITDAFSLGSRTVIPTKTTSRKTAPTVIAPSSLFSKTTSSDERRNDGKDSLAFDTDTDEGAEAQLDEVAYSGSNITNDGNNNSLDMEALVAQLQQQLQNQQETHQMELLALEEEGRVNLQQVETTLEKMRGDYVAYQQDMEQQLAAVTPSLQDVQRLEQELVDLQTRTVQQEAQLAAAKEQLATNRQARLDLQVEMVALREGYLQQLTDLEDALEWEQMARVKDQRESAKELDHLQSELRRGVQRTLDESKRQAELLTAEFVQQLAQRDEQLLRQNVLLQQARGAVSQREARIAQLESERQSLRKLVAASVRLIRQRIAKRLRLSPSKERRTVPATRTDLTPAEHMDT